VEAGLKKHGRYQLGTLGSGNHFIEIGEGEDGHLWIIVHSGSRNLGHFVASHYMQEAYFANVSPEEAAQTMKKAKGKHHKIPEHILEGHYAFPVMSQAGKDYITDMTYCLAYALENRKRMIRTVAKILGNPKELLFINRNHNHADYKEGLWIHRKGATHAEAGMLGVIPGNMRDGAFIVRGKGNPESLCSSSHGAGRRLSRAQAKKEDMESFEKTMTGVTAKIDLGTLDESPFAYKNIFDVMEAQRDMVEVIDYVRPLINIKGGGRPPFRLKV
jgi:tRNA-splicing ligase RtcB